MNSYSSCSLKRPKSRSCPCSGNFPATETVNGGQQVDHESFRSKRELEKETKPKHSVSNTENACAYYKSQPHSKSYSAANVVKHKLKRFLTEDSLPDQPKLTRSTEKLKEFLMTHADFLDSLYEKQENINEEQQQQQSIAEAKALPAEMWWVPPLKLPTSRSVPSVARSNCYSAASSTGTRSKTRRSVEDLRQRVDSVCDLIEAMGILETEQQNSCEETARSADPSIPLLNIPSIASQTSSRDERLKDHTSYKTVASQCTVVEPKISIERNNNRTESATLREVSSPIPEYLSSSSHTNNAAVRVASPHSSEVPSHYNNPQTSLSVSDLACIHIVNPMLSKLARLCTAQGQQYLTVLEELEKACNDFHNACKFQGATK